MGFPPSILISEPSTIISNHLLYIATSPLPITAELYPITNGSCEEARGFPTPLEDSDSSFYHAIRNQLQLIGATTTLIATLLLLQFRYEASLGMP